MMQPEMEKRLAACETKCWWYSNCYRWAANRELSFAWWTTHPSSFPPRMYVEKKEGHYPDREQHVKRHRGMKESTRWCAEQLLQKAWMTEAGVTGSPGQGATSWTCGPLIEASWLLWTLREWAMYKRVGLELDWLSYASIGINASFKKRMIICCSLGMDPDSEWWRVTLQNICGETALG
jgi:hypothetical protein